MPETHHTFCRICEALCGLEVSVEGGRIREIREASLKNFPEAVREFDRVRAYDNSRWAERPRLVFEARKGQLLSVEEEPPSWLTVAFRGTEYELGRPL